MPRSTISTTDLCGSLPQIELAKERALFEWRLITEREKNNIAARERRSSEPKEKKKQIPRSQYSREVIGKRILAAERERLMNLTPRDMVTQKRTRNNSGKFTPDHLLSKSTIAYRRKRQREIYQAMVLKNNLENR